MSGKGLNSQERITMRRFQHKALCAENTALNATTFKAKSALKSNRASLSKAFHKVLAISAAAAFCIVSANAGTAQTITANTTLNGNGAGISTTTSQWSTAFTAVANDSAIGWRGNSSGNPYQAYGYGYDGKGSYLNWGGSTKLNQAWYGVAAHNGTGKTVYAIENVAQGSAGEVWTAFNITGGTTTINADLNNIVFASYRAGMQSRNSFSTTAADKLLAVSNGATLSIGNSSNRNTEIKIGFGNYGTGKGGVYVRDNLRTYSGSGQGTTWSGGLNQVTGLTQSMNSWNQRVIEATGNGTRIYFNQKTKIVTTLDSTSNEPWYQKNNDQASNWGNYYNWNWGNYYDAYNSRALYIGNGAAATFSAEVSTVGTVEFNSAGTIYINSGAKLDVQKSTNWSGAGGDLIVSSTMLNNYGTIQVGRNLSVNNSNKTWYNSGTINVVGNATISNIELRSYNNNSFTAASLSLSNAKVTNGGWGGVGTYKVGSLSIANSTFDARVNSLAVSSGSLSIGSTQVANLSGATTLSGINTFYVSRTSKDVDLGTTSFNTNAQLRVAFDKSDAWNTSDVVWAGDNETENRVGKKDINKMLVKGSTLSANNAILFESDGTTLLNATQVVYTSGLVQKPQYTVTRNFGYGSGTNTAGTTTGVGGVIYNNITIQDHLYVKPVTPDPGPTPGPNPDPTPTPTPTPSEPERELAKADARLQGLIDINFMLAQFEMTNKFQTNFNPDEFIDNKKVINYKSKVRKGNKVISRVHRIYVPYDYNIWADAQYTNVSFANGLKDTDTAKGGTGEKQTLDTKTANGKVGIDFISEYEGYTRLYFGYNMIDATNNLYGNKYNGASYEAGGQMMAGLKLFGLEFQGYADIGYAYNSIEVKGDSASSDIETAGGGSFALDTNTHNAKAGLGLEKRVKLGGADLGLGVDLDYVFSMGKELSVKVTENVGDYADSLNGVYTTENKAKHYVIAGGKVFGGYGFNNGGTYVYAQGTFGYQLLGQDEFVNLDFVANDGTQTLYKVKNADYKNYLATAGLGLSQKIASNFNLHLQGTKLFSNNYTNDSYQARVGLSYKW